MVDNNFEPLSADEKLKQISYLETLVGMKGEKLKINKFEIIGKETVRDDEFEVYSVELSITKTFEGEETETNREFFTVVKIDGEWKIST